MTGTTNKFNLIAKAIVFVSQQVTRLVGFKPSNASIRRQYLSMTLLIAVNGVRIQVVNTLEKLTHANRPVNWRCLDLQHFLDFVEQLNGIANIAVQFIYKAYDRGITQSTDIH